MTNHTDWFCIGSPYTGDLLTLSINNLILPSSGIGVIDYDEDLQIFTEPHKLIQDESVDWLTLPSGRNLLKPLNMYPQATKFKCNPTTPYLFVKRDWKRKGSFGVSKGMSSVSIDERSLQDRSCICDPAVKSWVKRLNKHGHTSLESLQEVNFHQMFQRIYDITPEDLGAQLSVYLDHNSLELALEWPHEWEQAQFQNPYYWARDRIRWAVNVIASYTGNYSIIEGY